MVGSRRRLATFRRKMTFSVRLPSVSEVQTRLAEWRGGESAGPPCRPGKCRLEEDEKCRASENAKQPLALILLPGHGNYLSVVDGPPPEGGGSRNGLEALFRLKPAE